MRWIERAVISPVVIFALIGTARAANVEVDKKLLVPEKWDSQKKSDAGWEYNLTVGASFAFSDNSNVVGQIDGFSITLGGQLDSFANYFRGVHEWRNSLKSTQLVTRTPAIDTLVKTTDNVVLESVYLLHPPEFTWIGPFARFRLDTTFAPGFHVSGNQETYAILDPEGALVETRVGGPDYSRLKLSDAFFPMTIRESVGAFVQPLAGEEFTLEFKSGLGGQETFADDQRAVADDSATAEIEIQELRNVFQAGPVFGVDVWGALLGKGFSYYAKFEAMIPVVNNQLSSDTRGTMDLVNYLVDAGISLELVTWATLKYQFKLVREPQVLDATQTQHNLLLNFNYTVFNSGA